MPLFLPNFLVAWVTFADKPSAPRNLKVTDVTKETAGLTWEPSESDGGTPIKEYTIEKRDASRNNWIGIGRVKPDTTSFTACKLWEGCDYFFRVAAENPVGVSDFAELPKPVTAKLPYSM